MDGKEEEYRYTLTLRPEFEMDRKIMELIQKRDLFEYPTIKIFLMKKILQEKQDIVFEEKQRISQLEEEIARIKQLLGSLLQTVDELRNLKGTEKTESLQEKKSEHQEDTDSDEVDVDEDFAADFLRNYNL